MNLTILNLMSVKRTNAIAQIELPPTIVTCIKCHKIVFFNTLLKKTPNAGLVCFDAGPGWSCAGPHDVFFNRAIRRAESV